MAHPEIESFLTCIQGVDHGNTKAFADLVRRGMELLHLQDQDLAEEFTVARSTINRWRNGAVAPHPAMRKHVYKYLGKRARAVVQSAARSSATEKTSSPPSYDSEPMLMVSSGRS